MNYMYCPHCGRKIPTDSTFCHYCGYRLPNMAQQAQPQFNNNFSAGTGSRVINDTNSFSTVGLNAYLKRMYGWLFISLLIASISAYIGSSFMALMNIWVMIGLCAVGFIPMYMVYKNALFNPTKAAMGLIAFSIIDGLSLSSIFMIYTGRNLATAFVASSSIFAVMSVIGMITHKSLAKMGTQLFGALIALIVVSIIELFFRNTLMMIFISLAGVVIFSGFTVYDTKDAVDIYKKYHGQASMKGMALVGALNLYIDFENLFLDILDLISAFTDNN